jgi:3-oxoacyl-[acyl-carrier protein] reductase
MVLEGKRIIVTGGSMGIGGAAVRSFVAEGATVVAMARGKDVGEALVDDANTRGLGHATFMSCDVSSRSQVDKAFRTAAETMGGLDVLIHAAGIHISCQAIDINEETFDILMHVNVLGTIFTNQAAYRLMYDNGGAIVNFGSEGGISGDRNPGINAAYGIGKSAVHSWTRHVARDWAPRRIRTNAVLPYMWTPQYEAYRAEMTPEALARHDADTARQVPLGGKFGDPEKDLAPVLVFLASDASHYISGQMIPVDGGLLTVR